MGLGFALLTGGMLMKHLPAMGSSPGILIGGLRSLRSGMGPVAQPVFKTGEVW